MDPFKNRAPVGSVLSRETQVEFVCTIGLLIKENLKMIEIGYLL